MARNKIEQILDEIGLAVSGNHKYNSLDFSMYLEDFLIENYDDMNAENARVTELLNEEIPEICAMMEPGMNDYEFLKLLELECEKAKKKYYE